MADYWTECILAAERCLLHTIGFEMGVQHPHKTMYKLFGKKVEDQGVRMKILNMATGFINDSQHTTLCLQFSPEKIGLSAIKMCVALHKVAFDDKAEAAAAGIELTEEEFESISSQIMECYEPVRKKDAPGKAATAGGKAALTSMSKPTGTATTTSTATATVTTTTALAGVVSTQLEATSAEKRLHGASAAAPADAAARAAPAVMPPAVAAPALSKQVPPFLPRQESSIEEGEIRPAATAPDAASLPRAEEREEGECEEGELPPMEEGELAPAKLAGILTPSPVTPVPTPTGPQRDGKHHSNGHGHGSAVVGVKRAAESAMGAEREAKRVAAAPHM